MLQISCIVLKIFQADREELADNYETNQILYVADVEFAYEALHFCIYKKEQFKQFIWIWITSLP